MSENADLGACDPQQLLEQLEALFDRYTQRSAQMEQAQGVSRLFKHWFSGNNPLTMDSMHQEFLDAVADTVGRLTEALAVMAQADLPGSQTLAARAVARLLSPEAADPARTGEWFLLVAGYQSGALLPYLERAELQRVRDHMLAHTPRRMLYPKQKELLEQVEALLK